MNPTRARIVKDYPVYSKGRLLPKQTSCTVKSKYLRGRSRKDCDEAIKVLKVAGIIQMTKATTQLMATNCSKVSIDDEHELPKADVNDDPGKTYALKA